MDMDFTQNDLLYEAQANSTGDITSTSDFIMPGEALLQKRPFTGDSDDGEPRAKKSTGSLKWNLHTLTMVADDVRSGKKSPVSALNELGFVVIYTLKKKDGPPHRPTFTVTVEVADLQFEGSGHNKREARAAAARACLDSILNPNSRLLVRPQDTQNEDFSEDDAMSSTAGSSRSAVTPEVRSPEVRSPAVMPTPFPASSSGSGKVRPSTSRPSPVPSPGSSLFGAMVSPNAIQSPINLLYQHYPGLECNCTYGDGSSLDTPKPPTLLSNSRRFKVTFQVKGQRYEGYGSSKKLAKIAAARTVLTAFDEGYALATTPPKHHTTVPTLPMSIDFSPLSQTVADCVAKLVNEEFNKLLRQDVVHSKRKVLAGFVITINNQPEGAKIIALATGTKCVSGEHMSVRGLVLNDCHAEVVARRCLQRHLYHELSLYAGSDDPTRPIEDADIEPVGGGGYRLKPDRQVHLYVSTAPCGDGRIFSPHEKPEPQLDRHPNRLARGQLRTKIESGEGTIPVMKSVNALQTWDGILQGERLLTMSCSDKVARWCCVGLQGALLSLFLQPVYLHSLVLGSLLHPSHLHRAIGGRIEGHLSALPPPFRQQVPMLARAASAEVRSPSRAPGFSVAWCTGDKEPEFVYATTGKLESGQPSRLCKQSMFARWHHLVRKLPLAPQSTDYALEVPQIPSDLEQVLYHEAKLMCPGYQTAKQRLIEAFDKAKLGRWVEKPFEQDQFMCEIQDADPTVLFA